MSNTSFEKNNKTEKYTNLEFFSFYLLIESLFIILYWQIIKVSLSSINYTEQEQSKYEKYINKAVLVTKIYRLWPQSWVSKVQLHHKNFFSST